MEEYKNILAFVDLRLALIDRYKDLNLNENEVMVLLVVDYLIKKGVTIIAPETLANKMVMDVKTIDATFLGLINKGMINVKEDLTTSLDGLYKRLLDGFKIERGKINNYTKEESDNLYSLFENEFGRPLSSVEIDIMRSWMENGYSVDLIKEALKEAVNAKAKNIKYVDRILLSYQQEKEIKKEGFTTNSEKWRHNMDETIEIANLNWLERK
jgi:DNA replication protein